MAMKKVVVGKKMKQSGLTLPDEVVENLKKLSLNGRKAYAKRLWDNGWTLQSIATPLGVTRQAIEQYIKSKSVVNGVGFDESSQFSVPEVPSTPIYKTKREEVSLDVLKKLKELHEIASKVRSKSPKYREEAEQFTRLAWEQVQGDVTTYSLAKSLGITNGALLSRFVRYGYKTTNGKSKAYNQISTTKKEGN